MKKMIALLLALVMVLSMAACGSDEPSTEPTTPSDPINTTDASTDPSGESTEPSQESTEPTGESTEPTEPTEAPTLNVDEELFSKDSYTADNATLLKHKDDVVATIGEETLTMTQLQTYYWMYIYSFLNDYGNYLNLFALDISLPLDEQKCSEIGGTWQQCFLAEALNSWHANQSMCLAAQEQNISFTDENKKALQQMIDELDTVAKNGKYASVDEMLQNNIGPGVTKEGYVAYLEDYYGGYNFYNQTQASIEITDDMIEAYFQENKDTLSELGITKEDGKLVDVRHILLTPEGGTQGEDGGTTYSDAEWKKCEEKAQGILDQWLAGEKTEESFAALAKEHSTDPGSKDNGGLYQGVATGYMVEEFDAWCFDDSRKVGDYGLVKTTYGYHVMFYSGEEPQWIVECRTAIMNEKMSEIVTAAAEAYPLTADYEKIMLGHMDLE